MQIVAQARAIFSDETIECCSKIQHNDSWRYMDSVFHSQRFRLCFEMN